MAVNIADIHTSTQLREYMTAPTDGVVDCVGKIRGDIMILGGSGKMGPELTEMIMRADARAGVKRVVFVASSFSNPREKTAERFMELGVRVYKGELTSADFLDSLPDAANIVYMPGFKFGSSNNWEKAVQVNCILPYLVGEKYKRSRIVVFSSANPYAYTTLESGGSREGDPLDPKGIYGWSIVARESSFAITAGKYPEQRSCFYRLAYAQHLAYGVVVDLVRYILQGKDVSVSVPYVNLVLNVSGPVVAVRDLAERLGKMLGKPVRLVGEEPKLSQVINDEFCVERFGAYHDTIEDILTAAVNWVKNNGEYWEKPTKFGEAKREY